MTNKTEPSAPYWSLAGLKLGAQLVAPLVPATMAFGIAVGSATAAKGLTFVEHIFFNALVFAGLSQMVALEVWPTDMTAAAIAGLALVVATVNARLLLFGAGLRPWLGPLPGWQVYPTLHLLTDPGWIVAMRYRTEGGADAAVLLGSGLALFLFLVCGDDGGLSRRRACAGPARDRARSGHADLFRGDAGAAMARPEARVCLGGRGRCRHDLLFRVRWLVVRHRRFACRHRYGGVCR
jgi:hypothetical protein